MTSVKVGCAPPIWKLAQVQGLNESRLIISGDEDQDPVTFKEGWTRPFIWLGT